jgi:hypothetical protein
MALPDSMQFPSLAESILNAQNNFLTRDKVSSKLITSTLTRSSTKTIFDPFVLYFKGIAQSVPFDTKYTYNSELFAHDYMGSSDLAYLLLLINDIPSNNYFVNLKNVLYVNNEKLISDIINNNLEV